MQSKEIVDKMGQGQSRNRFEAAASDELDRAKYFIEHDRTDVNAEDKVQYCNDYEYLRSMRVPGNCSDWAQGLIQQDRC